MEAEHVVDTDWKCFGLCRGKSELFYAHGPETSNERRRREQLALRYCEVCPVKEPCRIAGRLGREHGVWGGETDEDRAAAGYLPTRSTSRRLRAAWQRGRARRPAGTDREADAGAA